MYLNLRGVSQPDKEGYRRVFFLLNGFRRDVEIFDESLGDVVQTRIKADPLDECQVAAPMPGKVLEVSVSVGDVIEKGQVLVVSEAMKMQYEIKAKTSGKVEQVSITPGEQVGAGDLLVKLSPS